MISVLIVVVAGSNPKYFGEAYSFQQTEFEEQEN